MEYAIRTLEIEMARIEEAQRVEERYSVYPEYRPSQIEWKERMIELYKAIDVLRQYQTNAQGDDNGKRGNSGGRNDDDMHRHASVC